MPNTKSAMKRLRQNEVRRQRNKAVKTRVKTEIKRVLAAVEAGNVAEAEELYKFAAKKIDQAGSSSVMHKNTAARQKSRLQKHIKAAKASA